MALLGPCQSYHKIAVTLHWSKSRDSKKRSGSMQCLCLKAKLTEKTWVQTLELLEEVVVLLS